VQEGGCVETVAIENKPSSVPRAARQGGEACSQRWDWVESSVWTKRMLRALDEGVKEDHQRWPNVYFGELGLFFMAKAWAALSQPRAG
jgi:hypothetical protein